MPLPHVKLTAKEAQLRRLLLDAAKSIDASGTVAEPVILRWAGGWVRDKLLGIESHDIDVAINAMTGVAFAHLLCEFCDTPDAILAHKIQRQDIGHLYSVARNPEKSKHLETASVKLFGLDLDFVNLRKETYAADSRNPQMEFGTAEEDARRRDATINALFYNLNEDRIEDFTGGVPDLTDKLIRTPLEPFQTFTDDPLRVLRLVRFASRLEFSIDRPTEEVMANAIVLDALKVKISRERVGIELEKMLRGEHPRDSLRLIDRLGLYQAIFTDPARPLTSPSSSIKWSLAYECLDDLLQNSAPGSVGDLLIGSEDAKYFAWNLAAVSPWMTVEDHSELPRRSATLPPVAIVAREGFKSPNKLTEVLVASFRHRGEILDLKNAVQAHEAWTYQRDRLGMMIRRWDSSGGSWKLQVLNCMLVEAMEVLVDWKQNPSADQDEFRRGWQAFLDHIVELDVLNATGIKRLLDGRQLAAALGTVPGKWTGRALDACMEWQLRNPDITNPAGAVEEVRQRRLELDLPKLDAVN